MCACGELMDGWMNTIRYNIPSTIDTHSHTHTRTVTASLRLVIFIFSEFVDLRLGRAGHGLRVKALIVL